MKKGVNEAVMCKDATLLQEAAQLRSFEGQNRKHMGDLSS